MRVCATMPYLLSFLTLLSPALTHSFTENIDVLVFVPRNNSYLFSHARVAPALLYAQRSLGADGGRYSGLSFAVQFANSDCFYEALFTLADKSGAQRPDLILGPVCEYEAAAVVRLASHWNIPVISAGALAAAFKNKKTEYSHLTRIAPSYVKMAEVFGAMFERFTWRSALLVYEDDQEERNCYFTIEGVYHHMIDRYDIHIHHVVEEEPTVTDELLQSIDDSEAAPVRGLHSRPSASISPYPCILLSHTNSLHVLIHYIHQPSL